MIYLSLNHQKPCIFFNTSFRLIPAFLKASKFYKPYMHMQKITRFCANNNTKIADDYIATIRDIIYYKIHFVKIAKRC